MLILSIRETHDLSPWLSNRLKRYSLSNSTRTWPSIRNCFHPSSRLAESSCFGWFGVSNAHVVEDDESVAITRFAWNVHYPCEGGNDNPFFALPSFILLA